MYLIFLLGIMGNIKLQNEPLILDGGKLVELHTTGLVNLPSVIQTANGEEIKLKNEVGNFTIAQVRFRCLYDIIRIFTTSIIFTSILDVLFKITNLIIIS